MSKSYQIPCENHAKINLISRYLSNLPGARSNLFSPSLRGTKQSVHVSNTTSDCFVGYPFYFSGGLLAMTISPTIARHEAICKRV